MPRSNRREYNQYFALNLAKEPSFFDLPLYCHLVTVDDRFPEIGAKR